MNDDVVEVASLIHMRVDDDKWWRCGGRWFDQGKSGRVTVDDENENMGKTIVLGKRESIYIICKLGEQNLWRHHC